MKIKLSKSQWEEMGKKAGWMKLAGDSPEEFRQQPISTKCHICGMRAKPNENGSMMCDNPKCTNYQKIVNVEGGRITL